MMKKNTSLDEMNIYNLLKFGDVIWAYRPLFLKPGIVEVPQGHREGPYVVVGYKNGHLMCFYATSVKPKSEIMSNCSLFIPFIEKSRNGLTKDTYIDAHRVIPIWLENFISHIGHLSLLDKYKLNLKIEELKALGFGSLNDIPNIVFPLDKGDIVWYENGYYLILERKKKSFIATELKEEKSVEYCSMIEVDGIPYYYNLDNIVGIRRERKPIRIGFIEDNNYLELIDQMGDKIREVQERKLTKKGSIIAYKHSLFYVFDENGENWKLFQVYDTNDSDLVQFCVGGKVYYIDFSQSIEVLKGVLLHRAVNQSSEEDIIEFNKIRKNYEVKNTFRFDNAKFNIGDIIVDTETRTQEFLVVLPYPDRMIVVKKDEIYTKDYHLLEKEYKGFSIKSSLNSMMIRDILVEIQNMSGSLNTENELKLLVKMLENARNSH